MMLKPQFSHLSINLASVSYWKLVQMIWYRIQSRLPIQYIVCFITLLKFHDNAIYNKKLNDINWNNQQSFVYIVNYVISPH